MSAPELVLHNATVLTVDDADAEAQAVAVTRRPDHGGGRRRRSLRAHGPDTKALDLGGATLVPGFVDPHSHVSMGAPYIKHAALQTPPGRGHPHRR